MNDEIIQGIFDFNTGNPDGYENWQREQDERLARIRFIWGLPVGRQVIIRLWNDPNEFEGKLNLAETPTVFDRKEPLHLKVGKLGFYHNEIESCAVIE
ncbi:MAG: hypothetical protein PF904_02715 [Kiritimatiellae bacterium]|jgi:hypothetical protein|nr:hypothetical protein [Kiritimatiellia bacterium]